MTAAKAAVEQARAQHKAALAEEAINDADFPNEDAEREDALSGEPDAPELDPAQVENALRFDLAVAERQRAILMEVAERLVNRLAGEKMAAGALLLPQAHAFINGELGSIQQALDSANG